MEIKLCYRRYLEIGNSNSSFVKVLSLMHCFLFLNNPLSKWCERMLNEVSFHMHPSSILLLTSLIECYYFLCLSSVRKAIVLVPLSDSFVQVEYGSRLYSCYLIQAFTSLYSIFKRSRSTDIIWIWLFLLPKSGITSTCFSDKITSMITVEAFNGT